MSSIFNNSELSRNTMKFDKKGSYFMNQKNQTQFMEKIDRTQSFCFRSIPRNIAYNIDIFENKEKLEHLYRQGDFKQTINPLVVQQKKQRNVNKLKVSDTKKETELQKMIDQKVLSCMHDTKLSGDRKQVDIRDQVARFKEWKVLRNQRLRSGILNVDGPLDSNTQLYQQLKQQIIKKMEKSEANNSKHMNWLATKQGTHQFINIDNPGGKGHVTVPVQKYDGQVYMQKKKQFRSDYQTYFKEDTKHDGVVKQYSIDLKRQKRKQNLYNQQIRGKNYNIVSNSVVKY